MNNWKEVTVILRYSLVSALIYYKKKRVLCISFISHFYFDHEWKSWCCGLLDTRLFSVFVLPSHASGNETNKDPGYEFVSRFSVSTTRARSEPILVYVESRPYSGYCSGCRNWGEAATAPLSKYC